jgi:hypothetical protein
MVGPQWHPIHWVYKTLRIPVLSMTNWPGESRWMLWSLIDVTCKSTSNQCRWRGGYRLKKDIYASRQFRHGLCMCAIHNVNGQDTRLKCLWTGYENRCEAHRFVSRTATLLGFSCSTVSHGPPPKGHPDYWHNCGKISSQHRPASLWNTFDTL